MIEKNGVVHVESSRPAAANRSYDLIVVGGGPAGMAAAVQAREDGIDRILIVERNSALGGILPQCIHDGFGRVEFGALMTGPEYASAWIRRTEDVGIPSLTDATVVEFRRLDRQETGGFLLKISSLSGGIEEYSCRSVILATGCRERSRGQLRIPGSRPAGVYTAGAVQYMMNIQNYRPGKTAVILGSGDIGLIMARRMTWEGIYVKMILGERASGLMRNYIQCVKDWEIPIRFSHTVTKIHGRKRLTGVTIAPVRPDGTPEEALEEYVRCDLLVIAAGLIPETEVWKQLYISRGQEPQPIQSMDEIQTQESGVFVCGNIVKQYDTVDEVSAFGRGAGRRAAEYLSAVEHSGIHPKASAQTIYSGPKHSMTDEDLVYLTSPQADRNIIYCTGCPRGCRMTVTGCVGKGQGPETVGNRCGTGRKYALQEMKDPRRMVTTTVKVQGRSDRLLPVRTSAPVRKQDIRLVLKECAKMSVSLPVLAGDVLKRDIMGGGSGIDLVSCANAMEADQPESGIVQTGT